MNTEYSRGEKGECDTLRFNVSPHTCTGFLEPPYLQGDSHANHSQRKQKLNISTN